ncbi:pyrroline-5-carboxylate reductase [Sphingomonas sp. LB-2]|uniref:pyrroline-5-carboxylate reductase n=1 Tax=Sphingomonas caeni TaxID=2984949 RepID=UPI002230975E|nr:pyrroline-5-carboxylate reductase [Sphingomonas caeni]MCW3847342.1 pyrroline-5-carboxylate reductase [Sphingomonas caeni]
MGAPASIWLVGCGNMGGAMLRGWIASGIPSTSITVIDPQLPPVPAGVTALSEVAPGSPDVLILAVKPQMLEPVAAQFAAAGVRARLLISVLAGVEEAVLGQHFEAGTVIRAMPNLPGSIGQGVVALHSDGADPPERAEAELLMKPLGLVEWIGSEALFDAVTALSGSGPGFVYRFIEALAEAGRALGLPADQAERFAIATVEGAASLGRLSGENPATLANRVASPGGTTRAGLDVLDHDNALKRLIHDTLTAAARRSAELAEAARN